MLHPEQLPPPPGEGRTARLPRQVCLRVAALTYSPLLKRQNTFLVCPFALFVVICFFLRVGVSK